MGEHGPSPKAPKRLTDAAHSTFIHELGCCLTGARFPRIIQHHLLRAPSRQGGRSGDHESVPMSDDLHKILHDNEGNERRFMAQYIAGSPVDLAHFLYENTGDHFTCGQYMARMRRKS